MFFLGLVTGFILGAIWMVGARIVVKMRRERIVASSASRNMPTTPCCYDCGGVPDSSGKVVHVDGCHGD